MGNTASGLRATISGGSTNTASGLFAAVCGGSLNTASGLASVVPGGDADTAAGDYSFAFGRTVKVAPEADYTFAFGRGFTTVVPNAVIFYNASNAIRVGLGATAPNTTADIEGDLALRAGSFVASNGSNNNINIGQRSFVRITGPAAVFSITGIAGGYDGKMVILYNTTAFAMTIANESANSNAGNRILTMTGVDEVTVGTGCVTLIYDVTGQRWIVTSLKP